MTDERHPPEATALDTPLDPWMASLARDATEVHADAIPREMMWARIQQRRRSTLVSTASDVASPVSRSVAVLTPATLRPGVWIRRAAAIAAVLVGGIGVGRYLVPAPDTVRHVVSRTDSVAALGLGPEALAAMPRSDDPVRVAMDEHLASTVALLLTVRNEDPAVGAVGDVSGWARDLLATTRLLLDEPQLRDERTRRLLQDLELVLVQIVQARRSAPATQRAPSETMRETNLLPRVRAAVTASRRSDDPILGGGL